MARTFFTAREFPWETTTETVISTCLPRNGDPRRSTQFTPDLNNPSDFMVWEVNAGSHYLAQSEFTAHFGLGNGVTTVDEILIAWPNGITQRLTDITANSLLTVVETPADFDASGTVDGADLAVWEQGFGQFPAGDATLADGDANGDGFVSGTDFLLWQSAYGSSSIAAISGMQTGVKVPEPATVWLLLIAGTASMIRRRWCRCLSAFARRSLRH